MSSLHVARAAGVRGRLRVPGDKSMSHRALLLAALAEGRSIVTGLSDGADVAATARAVAAFGAELHRDGPTLVVEGPRGGPREPSTVIDVGNSGTGIRLLAGFAAGVDGLTVLFGDESVARRPMGRVAEPLRLMGASVDGRERGSLPPLVVRGGGLSGIDYRLPVPSAQVKGAVLLAGLAAQSPTTVREESPTRAHTEEMLAACGAKVEVQPGYVTVHPGMPGPARYEVPADPSQAAFWIVAACITPDSDLTVEGVYTGPRRAAFLDVLRRMGADIEVHVVDEAAHVADIRARSGPLTATSVGGDEVPGLIDEIPILAVAAAYSTGTTVFSDAAELKVKESNRIETMVAALRAAGADASARDDGLAVEGSGGAPLPGGGTDSAGDHRVAMAMAIAALASRSGVLIDGWEAVATSYPRFEEDLRACVLPCE